MNEAAEGEAAPAGPEEGAGGEEAEDRARHRVRCARRRGLARYGVHERGGGAGQEGHPERCGEHGGQAALEDPGPILRAHDGDARPAVRADEDGDLHGPAIEEARGPLQRPGGTPRGEGDLSSRSGVHGGAFSWSAKTEWEPRPPRLSGQRCARRSLLAVNSAAPRAPAGRLPLSRGPRGHATRAPLKPFSRAKRAFREYNDGPRADKKASHEAESCQTLPKSRGTLRP